ncbi:MAG: hypothetical protein K6E85_17340 [Lachnospiraceae bacterium]|nr:hypothetical protein [Lachnospiraceae bacterium]
MKLYKRLSVFLTMGIMGIGLISFSTVPGADIKSSANTSRAGIEEEAEKSTIIFDVSVSAQEEATPTPTSTPTPEPTPTPAPNYLQKNSNTKISDLVKAYLNAKLTCDVNSFKDIVTDTSALKMDTMMKQTETVLSYDLRDCYTKRGYGSVSYVVYYVYYMNITTLSSPVLAFDSFMVNVDDNGTYRVFTGNIDNDVEEKLKELNNDADVQAVVSDVMAEINKEMDEDETVLQYWQRLYEQLGIEQGQ